MKLAQLYLEGKRASEILKYFIVSPKPIRYWGDFFKLHSTDSLIKSQPNPSGSRAIAPKAYLG
ncbi:MAG: hypothetical protein ACI97K_000858 [Glaciecola sp.]|jgi:hypothetical protein